MSEPGAASVVPIALVMNGRTGHTIWAAPWLEDGEEWQAFLGANGRVWLFEDLADLAGTLRSTLENDLSDHPSWPMLRTLPASQLVPDDGYRFDLDGVPGLTEAEADAEVVEQVTDAVDMVERIAECCDNGTLLRLLEQPGFADLLGFEEEDEEDEEAAENEPAADDIAEEDAAEDEEAAAAAEDAAGKAAGAEDEEAAKGEAVAEDEEATAENVDEDEAEDEADAEDEAYEEEDDEDEDDDAWAEIGTAIRTAWPGVLKKLDECVEWRTADDVPEPAEETATDTAPAATAGEDEDDEADTRFWDGVGIMPVELALPSGTGYTLRCYVDDEPRFLGTDMTVDIFRSKAGLVAFCQHEDNHDLAELDTWAEVHDAEELDVTPPAAERYDLLSMDAQLIGGPTVADVRLMRGAIDVVQDLAEYCELAGVQAAFGADSPLGTTITELFATNVGSSLLMPTYWSGEGAAAQWRTVLDEIDSCMRWHD